jgi:hypothetical protein
MLIPTFDPFMFANSVSKIAHYQWHVKLIKQPGAG